MKKEIDDRKIDPNMAVANVHADGLRWLSPKEAPLRLTGFPWIDQYPAYRRFPDDEEKLPKNTARPGRADPTGATLLSWYTAGGQVQFKTDSSRIAIRARLSFDWLKDHMPQTGTSGFDVYCAELGRFRFVGVTRFELKSKEFVAQPVGDMPRAMREFLIHFPLFNGIESVEIGIDADAAVEPPTAWTSPRPVVAYGTSILHGGCASRPGMSYPNLLCRHLNMPVLNFGFSGSGKGEAAVAGLLAEIKDPSLYIIDYQANVSPDEMAGTLPPFLDILRKKYPDVPILVVSAIMFARDAVGCGAVDRPALRRRYIDIQQGEVNRRRAGGDRHIHFLDGSLLMGEDWDECTVDGIHPTDLGFYRMAENLRPAIVEILEKTIGYKA